MNLKNTCLIVRKLNQLIQEFYSNNKGGKNLTTKIIRYTDYLKNCILGSNTNLINFTLGLIHNDLIDKLDKILGNSHSAIFKARKYLNRLSRKFKKKF